RRTRLTPRRRWRWRRQRTLPDDDGQREPVAAAVRRAANRPASDGGHAPRRADLPDRQHPALRPWPAARANTQRTGPVNLEFSRHAGIPGTGRSRRLDGAGVRPRARRVGTRWHAAQGSDPREAPAVGDVLRAPVRRANALQDRLRVRGGDTSSRGAGGVWTF